MNQEVITREKIDVLYLDFVELGLFLGCVGTKAQIQNLRAYEHFRKELHSATSLTDFLNRTLSYDLFCYLSGETLYGKLLALKWNRKIAKAGRKIKEVHWLEAVFMVSPAAVGKQLGLSNEEIKELQKNSMWASIFDYEDFF